MVLVLLHQHEYYEDKEMVLYHGCKARLLETMGSRDGFSNQRA